MKRIVTLSFCCLLVAMALLPMTVSAGVTELRLASFGAPQHFGSIARMAWIEEVNKTLEGRVKIIDYPGGQLYGPKDMHKAVAKGSVDMGVVLQPAMLAMIPMVQGVYLPFAFENLDQVAEAYSGESRKIIEKAMEKKQLKLLWVIYLDAVHIFSNKGNIEKVEDFKGLRVLSQSPIFSEILAALGAAPDASIPQTEQYMALKRAVSDSMAQSIVGGFFQKSYEVAPYVTKINMSYATVLVCANLKTFNRLPKDVQEVMLSTGKKYSAQTLSDVRGWEHKFTGEMAKAGATITTIAPEERAKIVAVAKPIWEKWARENGKDAQRLLELNVR